MHPGPPVLCELRKSPPRSNETYEKYILRMIGKDRLGDRFVQGPRAHFCQYMYHPLLVKEEHGDI